MASEPTISNWQLAEDENSLCRDSQCINVQKGFDGTGRKVNNSTPVVTSKLPHTAEGTGAAYSVCLKTPHSLLTETTLVLGADVTHGMQGASMARRRRQPGWKSLRTTW